MNKGYLCTSDTTIIADEKGEQFITEYCDNIDEILVQENVIEKIEKDLQDLEKKKKITLDRSKFGKKLALLLTLLCVVAPPILELMMGINPIEAAGTNIFGYESNMWLTVSLIGLTFAIPIDGSLLYSSSRAKKEHKGFNSAIIGLQNQLTKEKIKLNELNKSKTYNKTKTLYKSTLVDDSKELKRIDSQSELYHDLETYKSKMKRLNRKGKLQEYLQSHYNANQDDIAYVQEHLKEKGLALVRRK